MAILAIRVILPIYARPSWNCMRTLSLLLAMFAKGVAGLCEKPQIYAPTQVRLFYGITTTLNNGKPTYKLIQEEDGRSGTLAPVTPTQIAYQYLYSIPGGYWRTGASIGVLTHSGEDLRITSNAAAAEDLPSNAAQGIWQEWITAGSYYGNIGSAETPFQVTCTAAGLGAVDTPTATAATAATASTCGLTDGQSGAVYTTLAFSIVLLGFACFFAFIKAPGA